MRVRIKKLFGKNTLLKGYCKEKILRDEVIQCVLNGEIIENYISDKPFASCLVFGYRGIDKPLHVVCSFDDEYIYIITAYIPDTIKFYDDLKTRKEN